MKNVNILIGIGKLLASNLFSTSDPLENVQPSDIQRFGNSEFYFYILEFIIYYKFIGEPLKLFSTLQELIYGYIDRNIFCNQKTAWNISIKSNMKAKSSKRWSQIN